MGSSVLPPPDSASLRRTSPESDETAVAAICRVVADVAGVRPLELPPLGEVVDTHAVEAVASPRQLTGHLAFEYLEYVVVLHADGDIAVYDGH